MSTVALFAASLAGFAFGAPAFPIFPLPCSAISGTPCICPVGTDYGESVTTAIIGASASDVGSVVNDFFNPSWTGHEPWTVQGPDNVPLLSIRSVNSSTLVGDYTFEERVRPPVHQLRVVLTVLSHYYTAFNFRTNIHSLFLPQLTFIFTYPDGSFEQRYEQRGIVPYRSGNGSFSGLWATLKGTRVFQNETLVRYSSYSCETGHSRDHAPSREKALNNVTTILQGVDKLYGVSTSASSAQLF
ncbi:hypothetical protein F4678DRAFT_482302 [Xylaria arbuscula]|nr:hypothetical protein F4678DRAFT_482302 [Xylaria arbuscula]